MTGGGETYDRPRIHAALRAGGERSSISLRSVSSRLPSRAVKSFALKSNAVQFSFQPPPVPRLRVQSGDAVHPLARHFKARLAERVHDLVPIPHGSVLDALERVVADQVAG